MRAAWNPTRRNRNLGTAKAGHGQDNRLVIPSTWADRFRPFWEKLTSYTVHTRAHGRPITVLVEPARPGSFHACSVGDLFHLLPHIPADNLSGLGLILLRQPKRKEETLASCWGRFAYHVEVGPFSGPAVILEAQDLSKAWRWNQRLDPDDQAELERLRADGHRIEQTRRGYLIERTPESVRETQLYRTLLHEVGHWVDRLRNVERPSAEPGQDWSALWKRHFEQKPAAQRESFAHRYADELGAQLRGLGVIPFERIADDR